MNASAASPAYALAPGVLALPKGLLLLERTRTLVAADVHFGYEDAIGGALPPWSTEETEALLLAAISRYDARELVLLGDIVHSSALGEAAARRVAATMGALRSRCPVVAVAGNHEGRSRGRAILGETVEAAERDGRLLLHGDKPPRPGARCIVGHLHPSIRLGADRSIPAFLAGASLVVAPALTPYSSGLDVRSDACARAVRSFGARIDDLEVVGCGDDRVYPFGGVRALRSATRRTR